MKNITSKLLLPIIAVLSCNACSSWHKGGISSKHRTDSIAVHRNFEADSIRIEHTRFVFVQGDTLIVRDTLFRDRVRTVVRSDTLWREQEIYVEKPVRYVPRFYKGCVWAMGIMVLTIAGYIFFRIKRR